MANAKRTKVENFCLEIIGMITHNNKENIELYKDLFKRMSDAEFDSFMTDLKTGKVNLSIIVPHGNKVKIDINNNFKVAEKLGHDFFQHLHVEATEEIPEHITPEKYMIMKLPLRRASQLLMKKISVPEANRRRDVLTGQVTGPDRGRRVTYPEVQVLVGYGFDNVIKELMQTRGGDIGESNALSKMLSRTGESNLDTVANYGTGTRSGKTLNAYLQGMMIRTSTLSNSK